LRREKAAAVAAAAKEENIATEVVEQTAKKEKKKRLSAVAAAVVDNGATTSKKSVTDKKKSPSLSAPNEDLSMIDADDSTSISPETHKSKKDKKKKAPTSASPSAYASTLAPSEDVSMTDQDQATTSPEPVAGPAPSKPQAKPEVEDVFGNIYLRRVVAELTDDLDKVREANDFSNRSMPMLIHALRQGSSVYSAEERRRVIGASATATA
jgi:ribosome assembly protein 3